MTIRHTGYIVTLREPMREDDAEALVNAILLLGPVATVEPVVSNIESAMAVDRARWEMRRLLWKALDEFDRGGKDR